VYFTTREGTKRLEQKVRQSLKHSGDKIRPCILRGGWCGGGVAKGANTWLNFGVPKSQKIAKFCICQTWQNKVTPPQVKGMLTSWKQNTIPNVPRTYVIAACWKEKAHLNRFFIPINND
jgi:mannosyltransferase OCH1-like enzyme